MMCARSPRNPQHHPATVTPLHPGLDALTSAWAAAIAYDPRVTLLAAAPPDLRPVSPKPGAWVLQGPCTGGGVVAASIATDNHLSILHYGTGHRPTSIRIPLAELARVSPAA